MSVKEKLSAKNQDLCLKAILLGDSSVGESSILLSFIDKRFSDSHEI
jgi:GTPase SAR1 family protein